MGFPTTEDHLRRAEEAIGLALPPILRTRLLRENGGEVQAADDGWELFPVEDKSDRKRLSRTCNHFLRETAVAREWPDFPPDAIAIARNGTGNYLILRPALKAPGTLSDVVLLWDHETGSATPIDVEWDG